MSNKVQRPTGETAPVDDPTLRDRLLDAAVRITRRDGWGRVTMALLADEVGVSRQTVYNEFGSRTGVADAMVRRDLDGFYVAVGHAFDENPASLGDAIRQAVESTLRLGTSGSLTPVIVGSDRTADAELLRMSRRAPRP